MTSKGTASLLSLNVMWNTFFKTICTLESVEKKKPSYNVGGNTNWCSHYGALWKFLKKSKSDLPYDPAILVLGVYLE